MTEYYTLYNGKCKSVHILDPVPVRVFFKLYVGPRPVTIFLLRHPTEVLQLIFQTFYPAVELFEMSKNLDLQMQKETYTFKSIESRPCVDGGDFADFGICVIASIERMLIDKGFECVPPHLESVLPRFKDKNCTDIDQIRRILALVNKQLSTMPTGESDIKCGYPCTMHSVTATKIEFSYTTTDIPNDEHKFLFLPRFANGYVKTTSEYFIYTPLSILTATGGAMGMFLGWSVYQNHHCLVILLERIVNKLCKRSK